MNWLSDTTAVIVLIVNAAILAFVWTDFGKDIRRIIKERKGRS